MVQVPEYDTLSVFDLPLFIVLGLVCGVASSGLLSLTTSAEKSFLRLRNSGVQPATMPVLGGLACGSVALLYPEVTYQGFENVNALLQITSSPAAVYTAAYLLQVRAHPGRLHIALCPALACEWKDAAGLQCTNHSM